MENEAPQMQAPGLHSTFQSDFNTKLENIIFTFQYFIRWFSTLWGKIAKNHIFMLLYFNSLRSAAATRLQLFYYVLIHFRLLISSLLLLDLTECTQDLVGPSKTDLGYEVRTQYNFASTHASWCDNDNLLQVLRIEDILPADNVTYDKNKPPTFRQVETPPRLQR